MEVSITVRSAAPLVVAGDSNRRVITTLGTPRREMQHPKPPHFAQIPHTNQEPGLDEAGLPTQTLSYRVLLVVLLKVTVGISSTLVCGDEMQPTSGSGCQPPS